MSGISAQRQKYGQGQIIPANKRRRMTAEPSSQRDRALGDTCDYLDDDLDEENPFDSINILLDRREAEAEAEKLVDKAEQLNDTAFGPAESGDNSIQEIQHDEPAFSQHSYQFSCHASLIGEEEETSQYNKSIAPTNEHFFGPTDEQKETVAIETSTNNKRTKQFSIIKSSTPRFTFQSTVKATTTLQTPSHRQSLPNRNLFSSQSVTTQKSAKLTKRHTFRKSIEKPAIQDARNLGCTPSFLPGRKRTNGISPDIALPQGPASTFASLKSSVTHDTKPNTSRGGKAGYLIQRLRSLRNNDQRMAMRLRSGQLLSSSSVLARKRRRSSEFFDAKNSIKTELDVTVSNITRVFGESRTMVVGYIHRFECVNGGTDYKWDVPCFAWLILSNDVMREQGMSDGTVTKLKLYDAMVISKRIPDATLETLTVPIELAMPTVVCGGVCEQYTSEVNLPEVSFDKFAKSV